MHWIYKQLDKRMEIYVLQPTATPAGFMHTQTELIENMTAAFFSSPPLHIFLYKNSRLNRFSCSCRPHSETSLSISISDVE